MAGPFSFLPLSNKPGLKSLVQAKQKDEQEHKILPEHRSSPGAELEMNDKDDEWYDTASSSEEGHSPVKRSKSADFESSVVSVKPISSEEEERLLPYMPAIFSSTLPPCGPEVQLAYEAVLTRLRTSWFSHRGRQSTLSVCHSVKDELRNQNYLWPPFSIKGKFKRRKPWCRENVFKYQLCWVEYFEREAQAQVPELMTESEIMEKRKESSVPMELKFNVENQEVLRMWDEWNVEKRARRPAVPDVDLETGFLSGASDVHLREDVESTGKGTDHEQAGSSDMSAVRRANTNADDDAHLWAQRDHD